MVIEKLDALESALSKVLEEIAVLRRSRDEIEARLERTQAEASSAGERLREREQEMEKLKEENDRLQREQTEVRERVERILANLPSQ